MWDYRTLLRDRRPARQLVLQLTEQCNARCPQCGMNVRHSFPRASIDLERATRIVEQAARKNVKALSFTGGEPLLRLDDIVALAHRARDLGIPHVRTGTNGFLFRRSNEPGFERRVRAIARSLAGAGITTFWVSMDSADPRVHEEVRGMQGVCEGLRRALPIFHEEGLFPAANVGLTRLVGRAPLNAAGPRTLADQARTAFRDMFATIVDLGFTMSGMCYPMSMDDETASELAAYQATSTSYLVRFTPAEKAVIYSALLDVIPEVRTQVRLFTPRCNLDVLREENLAAAAGRPGEPVTAYPCRGGIDFFFIAAADGLVYPCGYRGDESLGTIEECDMDGGQEPFCTACEWECFRDPSELLGPLYEVQAQPSSLLRKRDIASRRLRYWFEDVRYTLACDMFDGRKPPDYRRMAGFDRGGAAAMGITLAQLNGRGLGAAAGSLRTGNGSLDTAGSGFPDTAGSGFPDPAGTGFPDPAGTGFPDTDAVAAELAELLGALAGEGVRRAPAGTASRPSASAPSTSASMSCGGTAQPDDAVPHAGEPGADPGTPRGPMKETTGSTAERQS